MSRKSDEMEFADRPIAFTDLETTGLDSETNEIIEVGLVLADQKTLKIIQTLEVKVRPEHPERMSDVARGINGYDEAVWASESVLLATAVARYAQLTPGAIFCAQNPTFDWPFMHRAFKMTGVESQMDYHRLDIFTMAWTLLRPRGLTKPNLRHINEFLGIKEEPKPHRALNGAMKTYETYQTLVTLL